MSEREPVAVHEFQLEQLDRALEFLKRTRNELRMLRKVRVWTDRLEVVDINGDAFEIRGVGYPDAPIVALLDAVDTPFKRETIHAPTDDDFKEFKTGRRYPWAADRVM